MHQAFKEKAHRMNQNFKIVICLYLFSLVVYFWVGVPGIHFVSWFYAPRIT